MVRRIIRIAFKVLFGFVVAIWLLGSCSSLLTSSPPIATPTSSPSAAAPQRLLPPVHAKRNRNYAFMSDIGGASWDPCLPITYVVNPANQPAGGLKAVQSAMSTVSAATGLKFVYGGRTREKYSADRAEYQPARYPGTWAPLLVSWETDKQFNRDLRRSGESSNVATVVGYGGPQTVTITHGEFEPSESFIVTGTVTLRASYLGRLIRQGAKASARGIIIHELGHVVGLNHVKSATQIMHATISTSKLGAGDRYGFAIAGNGVCAAVNRRPVPQVFR